MKILKIGYLKNIKYCDFKRVMIRFQYLQHLDLVNYQYIHEKVISRFISNCKSLNVIKMNYHSKLTNSILDFIPRVLNLKEFSLKCNSICSKVTLNNEFSNVNLARLFYSSKQIERFNIYSLSQDFFIELNKLILQKKDNQFQSLVSFKVDNVFMN